MSAPELGMALDRHPVLLGQRAPPLGDPVRQREAPDVVQQAGGVGQLALLGRHSHLHRDVPREPGDRGRVPRAARWSRMSSERIRPASTPHDSETYCSGALARLLEQVRHVGEREHRGQREGDAGVADLERDADAGDGDEDAQPTAGQELQQRLQAESALRTERRAGAATRTATKLRTSATAPAKITAR